MIVGEFFDGDIDKEVAWKQHDVYGSALRTIIDACCGYALFARDLLNDQGHEEWGTIRKCDHRTLQGSHDLLAAAWRFRHDLRQPELPLANARSVNPELMWLDWLRDELVDWRNHPELVKSVLTILSNQNQPAGYLAESQLRLDLLGRFHEVPWKQSWRDAYEQDHLRDLADVAEDVTDVLTNCECVGIGLPPCGCLPCTTTAARANREGWGPLEERAE